MIEQGKTAKEAALLTGINIRTAQHYIKKYNDDEERRLPLSGRKPGAGREAKLTEIACFCSKAIYRFQRTRKAAAFVVMSIMNFL